jgi:hypothetical protein
VSIEESEANALERLVDLLQQFRGWRLEDNLQLIQALIDLDGDNAGQAPDGGANPAQVFRSLRGVQAQSQSAGRQLDIHGLIFPFAASIRQNRDGRVSLS